MADAWLCVQSYIEGAQYPCPWTYIINTFEKQWQESICIVFFPPVCVP